MIPPHCSFSIVKRSEGKNALDKASYNLRCPMTDLNSGSRYDYSAKGPCLHSEIVIPSAAPPWAQALRNDPQALWSLVEKTEIRNDAQLLREAIISGPHMFTLGQLKVLFQNIARNIFAKDGMLCHFAIHPPDPKGDSRNYHGHFMLTMRKIDLTGFGKKDRTLNQRAKLQEWRKRCETEINLHLKRYGYKERVDYRSLKEQGLYREPTKRMGARATYLERQGIRTRIGNMNSEIKQLNQRREFIRYALTNLAKAVNKNLCPSDSKLNGLLNQQNNMACHLGGTQLLLNKITDLLLMRKFCDINLQSELVKLAEHVDTPNQINHENQHLTINLYPPMLWKRLPDNFPWDQHFLPDYILAAPEQHILCNYIHIDANEQSNTTLTDEHDFWDKQLAEINRMIEHEKAQQEILLKNNLSAEETKEIYAYDHEFLNNPYQHREQQLFLEI